MAKNHFQKYRQINIEVMMWNLKMTQNMEI